MKDFRAQLAANLRAIGAIVKKDLTVFFRYPANAIMSVIEPLMWIAPVYFMGKGFSVGGQAVGFQGFAGTTDYTSFVVMGAFMSAYIGAAFWGMGYSMKEDMQRGVFETNWVTPAGRATLVIGRGVFQLILTTVNSIVVMLLGALIFRVRFTGSIVAAILLMIPMLIALMGFGLGLAGVVMALKQADAAIDISNYVVTELSGTSFPVSVLPRPLLAIALALPTTYGFDAVRGMLLRTNTLMPLPLELAIMGVAVVVMCIGGYAVFNALEHHCRRLGTLGTH